MIARLALGVAATLSATSCIFTPEQKPNVNTQLEYSSRYIHRGQVMNQRAVAQGSLDVDLETKDGGRIFLGAFGNLDLHDSTGDAWMPSGHDGHITESRGSVAYGRRLSDHFAATAGLRTYVPANGNEFPFGARGPTTEFFTTIAGNFELVRPRLQIHKDFDEADGLYLRLGASRNFPVNDELSIEVDASMGWHDENAGDWEYALDESGLTDALLQVTGTYQLDEITQAFLRVSGVTLIDSDYREWADDVLGTEHTNFWFGAGLRWQF